jgi:hypothetical protein
MHTDQFETVLPKTERFFPPKSVKAPPSELHWLTRMWLLLFGAFMGVLFCTAGLAALGTLFMPKNVPAPLVPPPQMRLLPSTPVRPTPAQPTLLPEVRRAAPVPVPLAPVTPRAQLLHIRTVGTYENDLMPDGRTLRTLYKGELPSAANLPRTGGQPGDMWFTRNDGHAWVLAPLAPGSATTGWIDP